MRIEAGAPVSRPLVATHPGLRRAACGPDAEAFLKAIRTGHNPKEPSGQLLQVMPGLVFSKKTERDLVAVYDFLRAIPALANNPNPGAEP